MLMKGRTVLTLFQRMYCLQLHKANIIFLHEESSTLANDRVDQRSEGIR